MDEASNYHGGSSELQKIIITYDDELFVGSFSDDELQEAIRDDSSDENTAVNTGDNSLWMMYSLFAVTAMCLIAYIGICQKGKKYEK